MKPVFYLLGLSLFLGLTLMGCKKPVVEDPIPTLSVDFPSVTVKVPNTHQIVFTIGNTDAVLEAQFTSDAAGIASVDASGLITAVAEGTAVITVSLTDYPTITATVTVTVQPADEPVFPLTLVGDDSVIVGQTITLVATDADTTDNAVFWESSNIAILQVSQNGVVTGIAGGTATVTIISTISGKSLEKEITVIVPDVASVEIAGLPVGAISLSTNLTLIATVLPAGAPSDIVWASSNEEVATIDEAGHVTMVYAGEVTMTATALGTEINAFVTFTVVPTPIEILDLIHVANSVYDPAVMFWGNDNPLYNSVFEVYGSVTDYYFGSVPAINTNYMLSPTAANFDGGTLSPGVEYIVVHDTANATAGAQANASWMVNPANTGSSWHFTIGNDGIFRGLEDNMIGWHAGDGVRDYGLNDTGIQAPNDDPVVLGISVDGFWTFNGTKSTLSAPTNGGTILTIANCTNSGIYTEIGENGNYYIGNTYYNGTYHVIANTGGGAAGIGIETAMNNGSDIYLTWHYTAKMVASLMITHGLPIERVRQHNFFSGKDCPRTMRNAHLWDNFLNMVKAEYMMQSLFPDYTFTFQSNSTQYVDNRGRVIALPAAPTLVNYTITVTNGSGYNAEKVYYTTLPARIS